MRFLGALGAGGTRAAAAAAAAAGFPLHSLYTARRRDPHFGHAWVWAIDLAAIDARGGELARKPPEGNTGSEDRHRVFGS